MLRFEDAPEWVINLVDRVQRETFPELAQAKIKIIFDLKKRKSRGAYILARIQKTSELLRFLTVEDSNSENGFDYFIYLDKMVFESIEEEDRVRIIRHELRHTFFDIEAKSGSPYKTVGHDYEDFYQEMEINKADPKWRQRCAAVADSLYEREEYEGPVDDGPGLFDDDDQPDKVTNLADRRAAKG